MSTSAASSLCIALIGNPNTGKSTLFSALAGVRQRVGNYPGVTVEKKVGTLAHGNERYTLIDLPGTYSLAPRSPDEMVAVDVLLARRADTPRPDAVLCIVDASNLQRNLYLVSQVLELGLPTVLALNMVDVARDRGITIDVAQLSRNLGIPVVEVQANRRRGIELLKTAVAALPRQPAIERVSPFPEPFQQEVAALCARLEKASASRAGDNGHVPPRFLVERLLLDTTGYLEDVVVGHADPGLHAEILAARGRLAEAGCQVPAIEAMSRYGWVGRMLDGVVTRPTQRPVTWGDRLDRVLTNRFWGLVVFLALMVIVFQSVFTWAEYPKELIEIGIGHVAAAIEPSLGDGALRSLVIDGLIGGVGGVLTFLPQIFILFFFIALLEDCGYMARAAYLMDKLMVRVGLSGKSFIPLLSSFACAIPGVMSTRTIENRRDRLTTILIAPLMSCSARLPVYTMLIAAFIPEDAAYLGGWLKLQGLTLAAMYLVGIVAATVVALVLKKTLLRGPTPPFVMELPSYKLPGPSIVLHRMFSQGWSFVRRAGTLIVAVAIVMWAALYYPHDPAVAEPFEAERSQLEAKLEAVPADDPGRPAIEGALAEIDGRLAGAYQQQSFLGRAGHLIEPAVRPLGWDWRIGCAAIASFPAREVVVATLGIIYNLGEIDVADTEGGDLKKALQEATWDGTDRKVFNIPVALSLMVFFALCAQCAATLVVIRRETDSWRWPIFTFAYMTVLAYLGALVTYQVGMLLS